MIKSKFKYYIVIWAVLVVLFNAVVFITPNELAGLSKFGGSFWIGYIIIMLSFVAQLGIAWLAIKDDDVTKLFYNIPLITISYSSLIVMIIVGSICMFFPNFPKWLGILICLFVIVFEVIALMQAQTAATVVSEIDAKIKKKTFFIKSLIVDVDSILTRATTQEISSEIKTVYDAVRYSDPMSNEALSGVETQITLKISELTDCVEKADTDAVKKLCKEIIILINDRNKKCKLLK